MIGKGAVRSLRVSFHTLTIVRGGWFVISFIHVTAKNANPLKLPLEGGGEKVWGTNV